MGRVLFSVMAVVLLVMGLVGPALAGEAETGSGKATLAWIEVDGQNLSVMGRIQGDVVLVPVRAVFEATGAKVDWFASEKKERITLGKMAAQVWVGKTTIVANGRSNSMPAKTVMLNDTVYAPVRQIAEALGFLVAWDQKELTVRINTATGSVIALLCDTCLPVKVDDLSHVALALTDASGTTYYSYRSSNGRPVGSGRVDTAVVSTRAKGLAEIVDGINRSSGRKKSDHYNQALQFRQVPLKDVEKARQMMLSFNRKDYNLLTNNCTTSVHDSLEAAGLNPPSDRYSGKPKAWFAELVSDNARNSRATYWKAK